MNSAQLQDWLDRHHVHVLRMEGVLPDGVQIGRFIHRDKFARSLPLGCPVSDAVFATDLSGAMHEDSLLGEDEASLRTLFQKPDLTTLITDGTDPDLGHCIVELVDRDGSEIPLCPRTLLRRAIARLEELGQEVSIGSQLQFNLFEEPFHEARAMGYRNLRPLAISASRITYLNRNAYPVQKFMNELAARLEWRGIEWESWNVESGPGKIALNLRPCDPLVAADRAIRTRHALFEVAVDKGHSVTFMPQPLDGNECYFQIEQFLQAAGERPAHPADDLPTAAEAASHWRAGQDASLAAATAFFCPSVNAYRALAHAPRTLPLTGDTPHLPPVLGSADLNPYLAITALLAGGIAGLRHQLGSTAPDRRSPAGRPATLSAAVEALARDELLIETLGREFLRYWIGSRKREEHLFAARSPQQEGDGLTDWELERYFELV